MDMNEVAGQDKWYKKGIEKGKEDKDQEWRMRIESLIEATDDRHAVHLIDTWVRIAEMGIATKDKAINNLAIDMLSVDSYSKEKTLLQILIK